jgi:hypothetical protein
MTRRPLESLLLNVAATAWIARGLWRVSRGRPPWRAR